MLDTTKEMYKLGKGKKVITISFPSLNLSYRTQNIEQDNIALDEALMSGDNIEFVGCISNVFQAQIHGASAELKNQAVVVSMDIDGQNDPVDLFKGYVYSAQTRSDLAYKEIVCYDVLHQKAANKDVASWYKGLSFPITMKNLRDSLFRYIGITQKETTLPNDNISIEKKYDPERLNALDIIKNICQFNGTCGIINRQGLFEYRVPMGGDVFYSAYPSTLTYPGAALFPMPNDGISLYEENFFYKSMQYEEFLTNKITRVEVRDDDKAQSYGYGNGTNKYIIQGNVFVYGLTSAQKRLVAKNIYNRVKNFQYRPCTYEAPGLPFAEVGSLQTFWAMDWLNGQGERVKRSFPLLQRTLGGIQGLTDKVTIKGKKEQTEFVSNLNVRIDLLGGGGGGDMSNYYTKDQVDDKFPTKTDMETDINTAISDMETPTGLAFASVSQLPAAPRANTLYGITGGIIIL